VHARSGAGPWRRVAQITLVDRIDQLRACSNVEEGYAFQQALLKVVLSIEDDGYALIKATKRVRVSKAPQVGAPEPQSGLDPASPETWQLEHDVCASGSLGSTAVSATPWPGGCSGYQPRHILALCRRQFDNGATLLI